MERVEKSKSQEAGIPIVQELNITLHSFESFVKICRDSGNYYDRQKYRMTEKALNDYMDEAAESLKKYIVTTILALHFLEDLDMKMSKKLKGEAGLYERFQSYTEKILQEYQGGKNGNKDKGKRHPDKGDESSADSGPELVRDNADGKRATQTG